MSKAVCVACSHSIDAAARICPYCGGNPSTGEKVDTEAVLREVFHPREVSASESVMEYARHRQGIVIATGAIVAFLILAGLHQLVTARNNTAVASGPAVPLSEVADVSDPARDSAPLPMPAIDFQFDGKPQAMRTFIVEQGAVTPPEIVAAQQAAAAQAAAKRVAAQPGLPAAARPPAPTPPH